MIETSSGLRFGCWDVAYPGLSDQMTALGWGASTNHWNHIYDFSPPPSGGGSNWRLIPNEEQAVTRWCELELAPEGLTGGIVTEHRGPNPQVAGCECPIAACDGTIYRAAWYSGERARATGSTSSPVCSDALPQAAMEAPVRSDRVAGGSLLESLSRMLARVVALFCGSSVKAEIKAGSKYVPPKPINPGEITTRTTTCLLQ